MGARRYLVSGRVQAVGFRLFTRRAAEACGVRGFVRNLSDGRVEVVAAGTEAALDRLRARLDAGPRGAQVTSVVESAVDETALPPGWGQGFTIETTV